jgi:hypothetical protein
MITVIKPDGSTVDSEDSSVTAATQKACCIIDTALHDIASKHGVNCAQFAGLTDMMFTQTDAFVHVLHSLYECSDMTEEDHDYELSMYLEVNAVMSHNIAEALGIRSELAGTIANQISAAHKRASTIAANSGAELH